MHGETPHGRHTAQHLFQTKELWISLSAVLTKCLIIFRRAGMKLVKNMVVHGHSLSGWKLL